MARPAWRVTGQDYAKAQQDYARKAEQYLAACAMSIR